MINVRLNTWVMRSFQVIVLLIGLYSYTAGQTGRAIVHLDKAFYVTGEVIWYSISLPDFFEGNDKVFKVRVVDDGGIVRSEYHHRSEGKVVVSGYYKIPYDASTGVYRIFIHGLSRFIGQDPLIAEVRVPVYNDFERVRAEVQPDVGRNLNDGNLSIDIAVSEESDEAVTGTIQVTDQSGQPVAAAVSVSVADAELCGDGFIAFGKSIELRAMQAMLGHLVFKGTITDKAGAPLQLNVLGAYSPEVRRVVYSKSDDNGKFFVNVPDFYGDRTVQYLGYSIEVDDFDVTAPPKFSPGPIDDEVVYTAAVLEYLELSRKRKRIYQFFTSVEANISPEPIDPDIQELKADYSFDIEEYEDFENVHSFFDELITPLKFQLQKDSTFKARLENPRGRASQETHLSGKPLFIIDGKATRNADFVANIDLSLVKNVDLFYNPKKLREYFNAVGRSGVVLIRTKLPDLEFPEEEFADIFEVHGLQPPAQFPGPPEASEVPFIAPQVYWNGEILTDADGTATLSWSTSADPSKFRVQAVARAKQQHGVATTYYGKSR